MKIHSSIYSALIAVTLCLTGTGKASAQKFDADGIRYSVLSASDKTVEVVSYTNSIEPSDYIGFDQTPAVPDVRPRKALADQTYTVNIPEEVEYGGVAYTVTGIARGAFHDKALLSAVTIPATVVTIGDGAFAGCLSLGAIINYAPRPQSVGSGAFSGVDSGLLVTVPAWGLQKYADAPVWQSFVNYSYFKIHLDNITDLIRIYLAQSGADMVDDKIYLDDITDLIRLYLK